MFVSSKLATGFTALDSTGSRIAADESTKTFSKTRFVFLPKPTECGRENRKIQKLLIERKATLGHHRLEHERCWQQRGLAGDFTWDSVARVSANMVSERNFVREHNRNSPLVQEVPSAWCKQRRWRLCEHDAFRGQAYE